MALRSLLGICVLIGQFSFARSLLIGELKWSNGPYMYHRYSSFLCMGVRKVLSSQWDFIDALKSITERRTRALPNEVGKTVVSETSAWRMQSWRQWKNVFYRCPCQHEFRHMCCEMLRARVRAVWLKTKRAASRAVRGGGGGGTLYYNPLKCVWEIA